ncbi:MAG: hypothetical protein GOMPHAMPRED_004334 [Gomphillus americanus]|uniref:Uncharacterized protein n=1 Tax=Gomphillus americanus TaxID=1940652 RepID=A0A8H3FM69_9LECA|nr:MAG: hypothetical protein GOMPHAMPRED_004334 [Gomphillus americanus]
MHSFTSSCTIPPEGTNFVSSAPIRGTLQILWSSFSVLVLCTWSVVHLNVPPQVKVRTTTQKLRRVLHRLLPKVGWMLFNVLAPEWIITKALLDWLAVRQLQSRYKAQAAKDNVPWSKAHTHFANMGGFGVSFKHLSSIDSDHGTPSTAAAKTDLEGQPMSLSHPNDSLPKDFNWLEWAERIDKDEPQAYAADAYKYSKKILSESNATAQGWQIDDENSKLLAGLSASQVNVHFQQLSSTHQDFYLNIILLKANLWILDATQLLEARELGIIDTLPNICEDDLSDRDNSNLFIKVVAAGQTCWFGLQFLVRFANKQTNTQLEVMVFAFAVLSVAVYALAWNRPKDPEYTIILEAARHPNDRIELIKIAASGSYYITRRLRRTIWISNSQTSSAFGDTSLNKIYVLTTTASMFASFFGALHCIAWNFTFPSRIDQIMWQVSSIITTGAPLLFVFSATIIKVTPLKGVASDLTAIIGGLIFLIFIPSFIIARMFILVEVFRSLGFQPSQAFETTWANNIPHIG